MNPQLIDLGLAALIVVALSALAWSLSVAALNSIAARELEENRGHYEMMARLYGGHLSNDDGGFNHPHEVSWSVSYPTGYIVVMKPWRMLKYLHRLQAMLQTPERRRREA